MSASVLSCALPLPTNYRMMDILSFHARDTLAVSESVEANQLRKGIVWQGSTACLTLRFLPLFTEIELSIDHTPASLEVDDLSALTVRMLGLNQPIDIFEKSVGQHPQLEGLINKQSGLRVPVAPTVFEAFSWAITGQQISIAAAISIRRKFIQLVGLQHSSGLYCYPDAQHVTGLSIGDLRHAGFSQSKAQTLLTVSQMALSGELELNNTQKEPPMEQIRQQWPLDRQLCAIRGYGWTVHCTVMPQFVVAYKCY